MNRTMTIGKFFGSLGAGALLLCAAAVHADVGSVKGKPMIPLQVAIEPTVAKMKPQNIKPGDVVEFRISARAVRGADEVHIEITLQDGAQLVSGDLKWSGPLSRTERKQLVISVRAPATGVGRIVAAVSAVQNGKVTAAKQTVYTLGTGTGVGKGKPAPRTRRDSKGREVVEY